MLTSLSCTAAVHAKPGTHTPYALKQKQKLRLALHVQDDSGPSGREGRKISDVVSYRSLNDIPSTTRAMVIQVGCCRQAASMLWLAAGDQGWGPAGAQSHQASKW